MTDERCIAGQHVDALESGDTIDNRHRDSATARLLFVTPPRRSQSDTRGNASRVQRSSEPQLLASGDLLQLKALDG
jgi:hypothetical protein